MELRHLRHFVAIGEEENYRRAAQRLHVAQTALSTQIQDLETELGFKLFDRLPRGVKLWRRREKTGSLEPAKQGRPVGGGKLANHRDFLIAHVERRPDITMPELAAVLEAGRGVKASPASLSRLLCRAGFTYKKNAAGGGARTR